MHAEIFEYNIEENIITARQNVIYENKSEKYKIYSEFMSYIKNQGKIFTQGKTNASIDPKYKIVSTDVIFLEEKKEFSSKKETQIYDEINYYSLDNFIYSINNQTLKGENIIISSNYKLPNNDKFYFSSGIINLQSKDFIAKDTRINIHKSIFNEPENDPRLYGVSSVKKGNKIIVNKAIFTNCQKTDDCPLGL